MRISRVAIRNFRNFRNLVIDPFPANAVIVGENGIGKSNLLYALRLVLDPDLPRSARRLRAEDICDQGTASLTDGVEVSIAIDLVDIDASIGEDAALDGCFVNLNPLTARITYTFRPRVGLNAVGGQLDHGDYEYRVFGGPDLTIDAPRRLADDVTLTALPPLRDAVHELSRWRGSPLQDLLDKRKPSASALSTAAKTMTDAMNVLADDEQITAVAADLDSRLHDMAGPRLMVTPTLGFASGVPERLLRSIRLFVDSQRTRTVGEASTGSANVIYLGLLLEKFAARKALDEIVDSILAVEEPEAHLHPVLQRQLFRYLLDSQTALVVTTHSPHIAAVTHLESIVLLRPDPAGGTTAAVTAGAGLSPTETTDLERYLDANRAELLFCSAAILVEGVAETYVLPALAAALGFDLDAHGVIVANISGTNFGPYRRVLGPTALHVPHVIITDLDPVNRKKYNLAGLQRAAALADPEISTNLTTAVAALIDAGPDAPVDDARRLASDADVFVGTATLEPDLAPLLATQMIAAHDDLEDSTTLRGKFAGAVAAVAGNTETVEDLDELMRRITAISKGRYAQRLAAHIDRLTRGDLLGELDDLSKNAGLGQADTAKLLLDTGRAGYVLAALDRISWMVRSHSLLAGPIGSGGQPDESSTEPDVASAAPVTEQD